MRPGDIGASGNRALVKSRAQPPEVALIGPLSSDIVNLSASPDLRGTVAMNFDAGATS